MLSSPQLNTKCCSRDNIGALLNSIDKVLKNTAMALLDNIRYGLTNEINTNTFQDLITYRDIIITKLLSSDQLQDKSWLKIISKVKNIINKNK